MHPPFAHELPLGRVPERVVRLRLLELVQRIDVLAAVARVLGERLLAQSGSDSY